MSRFDPKTGWVRPWPWPTVTPDEVEPFVDPATGQDTFTGRQVRNPEWYQRRRRRDARVAGRRLDELLSNERTDLDDVLAKAVDYLAALVAGPEVTDA